jgi:hypothetical protein
LTLRWITVVGLCVGCDPGTFPQFASVLIENQYGADTYEVSLLNDSDTPVADFVYDNFDPDYMAVIPLKDVAADAVSSVTVRGLVGGKPHTAETQVFFSGRLSAGTNVDARLRRKNPARVGEPYTGNFDAKSDVECGTFSSFQPSFAPDGCPMGSCEIVVAGGNIKGVAVDEMAGTWIWQGKNIIHLTGQSATVAQLTCLSDYGGSRNIVAVSSDEVYLANFASVGAGRSLVQVRGGRIFSAPSPVLDNIRAATVNAESNGILLTDGNGNIHRYSKGVWDFFGNIGGGNGAITGVLGRISSSNGSYLFVLQHNQISRYALADDRWSDFKINIDGDNLVSWGLAPSPNGAWVATSSGLVLFNPKSGTELAYPGYFVAVWSNGTDLVVATDGEGQLAIRDGTTWSTVNIEGWFSRNPILDSDVFLSGSGRTVVIANQAQVFRRKF